MNMRHDLIPGRAMYMNAIFLCRVFSGIFLFLLVFSFFGGARKAMANDSNNFFDQPGSFNVLWTTDMQYGISRHIAFDGKSKLYYTRGDTLTEESMTGVGEFELDLQNADLADAKLVGQLLCSKNVQSGNLGQPVRWSASFMIACVEDGKLVTKNGATRLIPENIRKEIGGIWARLSDKALKDGVKNIKLDFITDKVEYRDGHYIVSVRFINSGRRWIKFKTPDQWSGTMTDGQLGVGAYRKVERNGKLEGVQSPSWGFTLEGHKLLNRDEFPGGMVMLKPGESRVLKIQAVPDDKASKGTYEFGGGAFMNMEYEGEGQLLDHVDFSSIKTRITIDRDYPSTPAERKQWEATHRTKMSDQPVKPGEKFAEDGLYRAVRLIDDASFRGLFLKHFRAGDVATTEDVRMPMEQNSEYNIDGPVQWVWEGEAPQLNGPLYSSGYVEGTQHFCRPGANCPRSGRWVLRTRADLDYRYDLSRIIPLNQGQPMPSVRSDASNAEWEWVGPLT